MDNLFPFGMFLKHVDVNRPVVKRLFCIVCAVDKKNLNRQKTFLSALLLFLVCPLSLTAIGVVMWKYDLEYLLQSWFASKGNKLIKNPER